MTEWWILVGCAALGFVVAPSFHFRLRVGCLLVAAIYELHLRLGGFAAEASGHVAVVRGFAIGIAAWSAVGIRSKSLKG